MLCDDAFQQKRKYNFGGIWTLDLFRSFMKGETPSYSVSADWDLKPETVFFVCTRTTPRTEVKSISTTHAKTRSISTTDTQKQGQSITTQKTSQCLPAHNQFRTPHTKRISFDPNTKTESNSIPHKKINLISTPLKSSQFDAHSRTNPISMPRHKTKTKRISTTHKKPKSIDPHAENKFCWDPTKK